MQRILPAFVCLIVLFLAGCDAGPRYITVKGRVSLDGIPIENGLAHFEAVDGQSPSAKGGIIKNGEYTAQVPAGELLVRITGSKVVGTYRPMPESPEKDLTKQFVPTQFNDETTLKVTVQAKNDDLSFDLKSK